jgi:hypothetical protein
MTRDELSLRMRGQVYWGEAEIASLARYTIQADKLLWRLVRRLEPHSRFSFCIRDRKSLSIRLTHSLWMRIAKRRKPGRAEGEMSSAVAKIQSCRPHCQKC